MDPVAEPFDQPTTSNSGDTVMKLKGIINKYDNSEKSSKKSLSWKQENELVQISYFDTEKYETGNELENIKVEEPDCSVETPYFISDQNCISNEFVEIKDEEPDCSVETPDFINDQNCIKNIKVEEPDCSVETPDFINDQNCISNELEIIKVEEPDCSVETPDFMNVQKWDLANIMKPQIVWRDLDDTLLCDIPEKPSIEELKCFGREITEQTYQEASVLQTINLNKNNKIPDFREEPDQMKIVPNPGLISLPPPPPPPPKDTSKDTGPIFQPPNFENPIGMNNNIMPISNTMISKPQFPVVGFDFRGEPNQIKKCINFELLRLPPPPPPPPKDSFEDAALICQPPNFKNPIGKNNNSTPIPNMILYQKPQFPVFGVNQINWGMPPGRMLPLPNNICTPPYQIIMNNQQIYTGSQMQSQFLPSQQPQQPPEQHHPPPVEEDQWMCPPDTQTQNFQHWGQQQPPDFGNGGGYGHSRWRNFRGDNYNSYRGKNNQRCNRGNRSGPYNQRSIPGNGGVTTPLCRYYAKRGCKKGLGCGFLHQKTERN